MIVKDAVEISDAAENFITGSGGNAVQWLTESAGRSLIKVANATNTSITVSLEKELMFDAKEGTIPSKGIEQWGRKAGTYTVCCTRTHKTFPDEIRLAFLCCVHKTCPDETHLLSCCADRGNGREKFCWLRHEKRPRLHHLHLRRLDCCEKY